MLWFYEAGSRSTKNNGSEFFVLYWRQFLIDRAMKPRVWSFSLIKDIGMV